MDIKDVPAFLIELIQFFFKRIYRSQPKKDGKSHQTVLFIKIVDSSKIGCFQSEAS